MISFINRQRRERLEKTVICELAGQTAEVLGLSRFEISLVFVGDPVMQDLNQQYRGIDKPTDVLSFPMIELPSPYESAAAAHLKRFQVIEGDLLGEVVISTHTARRYAQELNLTFPVEIKTLIIHGILHLRGYDHETDQGEMERLERKLRKQLITNQVEW